MNMIVKSGIAGVLALAASGAYAAGLGIPANDNSDLVLVIQNLSTPANVYELDTSISINTALPSSVLQANATLLSVAGYTGSVSESTTLASFLAANPASGDGWTLEAAQYSGATPTSSPVNSNSKAQGKAEAIFTSGSNASNLSGIQLATFQGFLGGVQNDLTQPADGLGLKPLLTASEADTGTSYTAEAATKYAVVGSSDLASLGATPVAIYGFSGNGTTGQVESYLLGTATLSTSGVLTLTGNGTSTVPVPAAVWLFGSGLMGMVGVSRRRKAAA